MKRTDRFAVTIKHGQSTVKTLVHHSGLKYDVTIVNRKRHNHWHQPIGCIRCLHSRVNRVLGARGYHLRNLPARPRKLLATRKLGNQGPYSGSSRKESRGKYFTTFRSERKVLTLLSENPLVITNRCEYAKVRNLYYNTLPYLFRFLWKDSDRIRLHYCEVYLYGELCRAIAFREPWVKRPNRLSCIWRSLITRNRLIRSESSIEQTFPVLRSCFGTAPLCEPLPSGEDGNVC